MLLSSITLETSPYSSGLTPFCSFVIDMSVLWSFWKCADKIEQGPCHMLQCQFFFFLCFLVQNTKYTSSESKFLKRVAKRQEPHFHTARLLFLHQIFQRDSRINRASWTTQTSGATSSPAGEIESFFTP